MAALSSIVVDRQTILSSDHMICDDRLGCLLLLAEHVRHHVQQLVVRQSCLYVVPWPEAATLPTKRCVDRHAGRTPMQSIAAGEPLLMTVFLETFLWVLPALFV